jgi:hypothetical protein
MHYLIQLHAKKQFLKPAQVICFSWCFFEVIENELKCSKIGQNLQIWALYAYSAYLSITVPVLTWANVIKHFMSVS